MVDEEDVDSLSDLLEDVKNALEQINGGEE
jgi:hypothetical protein